MIKFGLFGTGLIGKVHAGNIVANPRAELAYIYDVVPEAAKALGRKYPRAKIVSSPNDIWKSDADAVLIASSTSTHAQLLQESLSAGKITYCEKPVDLDIIRVKSVVQKASGINIPVFMGFSRRYDTNHAALQQAVQKGQIGSPQLTHINARGGSVLPIEYIKVAGGQFRDQSVHFFDLMCWILDDYPVEVYAVGDAFYSKEIQKIGDTDSSMLMLRMSKGSFCQIDNTRVGAYGYDERIEVLGSRGIAESARKSTGDFTVYQGKKIIRDGFYPGWFERMEPTFAVALDAFVDLAEAFKKKKGKRADLSKSQKGRGYPSLLDGLRAQLIAEAATESLRQKKPVSIKYWQPQKS